MDLDDTRMVETRGTARLAQEAFLFLMRSEVPGTGDLNGDDAIQAWIARLVHGAEGTASQQLQDLKLSDGGRHRAQLVLDGLGRLDAEGTAAVLAGHLALGLHQLNAAATVRTFQPQRLLRACALLLRLGGLVDRLDQREPSIESGG